MFGPLAVYNSNRLITRQQFVDNLADLTFSLGEWIFAAMKLIKDHLKIDWCENRIEGFISRIQTEMLLSECEPGTFMLRFSERVIGMLSNLLHFISNMD